MAAPVFFSGAFAKFLKQSLNLNDQAYILTGSANPQTSATNAPIGSIYLLTGGASTALYEKLDNGSTTNWVPFGVNIGLQFANKFQERLDIQQDDSPFDLLTSNIFARDGATLNSALGGTATLNTATGVLSFAAISDSVTSVALLDSAEFSNDSTGLRDVTSVDLTVFWNVFDPLATYSVSRDGGVHYQPATMKRIGNSTDTSTGGYVWSSEDQDTITDTTGAPSATQDFTDTIDYISQPYFTAYQVTMTQIGMNLFKSGSPAGNYQFMILPIDSVGNPAPTNPIWVSGFVATSTLASTTTLVTVSVPNIILPPGKYYITVQTDAAYKTGYTSNNANKISASMQGLSVTNQGVIGNITGTAWTAASVSEFVYSATYSRDTSQIVYDVSGVTFNTSVNLNATTQQAIAQQITLSATEVIKAVQVRMFNSNTNLVGNFYVQILADNAGSPSTASTGVLAQSNAVPIQQYNGLSSSASGNTFDVAIPKTVLAAGTYWIALVGDATYKTSSTNLSANTGFWAGNRATNTAFQQYNGTSWSTVGGTLALFVRELGRPLDLRCKITAGTASTSLLGYGMYYDLQGLGIVGIPPKQQRFVFNSVTDNLSSFTITAFVPDPNLLTVYCSPTGQVFKNPDFTLQGTTVVFPANTFNNAGVSQTFTLIFDQNTGGAFDTSDVNGNLLGQNHLGSTNGAYDKSVSGRGIVLRNANGVLRELALDANDNIIILSTP